MWCSFATLIPLALVGTHSTVPSRSPLSLQRCSSLQIDDAPTAPVGLHLGVVCDKTLNLISGYRYTRRGSRPSYDLCQGEFDKLTPEAQSTFERIDPNVTPRRAVLTTAALAALTLLIPPPPPPTDGYREDGDYDDFLELPPLSPAEELVGFFFKPKVPATQRELAPAAPRRPVLSFSSPLRIQPASATDGCDSECKQRIADRRALFEQSRTTNDRQKILDLSRQRAAMYNTTFQGASCIPGIPCI